MSYIVEFRIETPIYRVTMESVPGMVLEHVNLHFFPAERVRDVNWAYGDDFEVFEDGLDADPTIAEFVLLAEIEDHRLYRVTFTEAAEDKFIFPIATELDVTFLDIAVTKEGVHYNARFPSREALLEIRDACRERDLTFHLNRMYNEEQTKRVGRDSKYGVTEAQREALLAALDYGYYAIPREATLEEVASELGISTQAISTRLRRGLANLLDSTLRS